MELEPTLSTTSVEGLFVWALGNRMTPRLKGRLKEVGIDLARPLQAAYTNAVWGQAIRCTIDELYSAMPPEQACFEIGKTMIMDGFPSTLVGRALVQLGRLIGPERVLVRMQRNHRAIGNFTTVELTKLSPTHFRIESGILPEFLPRIVDPPGVHYGPMNQGMYTGMLTLLKVKNPRVTWRHLDVQTHRIEYDLTWDAG